MKKTIILVIVILTGIAGYFGYQEYKVNEFVDIASPHLKNTSIRVAGEIDYMLASNSKITYKELLEKLEEDISEMDKRSLEIQTVASERNKEISLLAVEYVKASQVLSRSFLNHARKALAMTSASNSVERKIVAYAASIGTYSTEYERNAADKAMEELRKANAEFLDAIPEVLESAKAFKASREAVAAIFPSDSLVPEGHLAELIKKLSPEAKSDDPAPKK